MTKDEAAKHKALWIRRLSEEAKAVIIPLRGQSKIPLDPAWQNTKHGAYTSEGIGANNYGISLRPVDLVIDVDPRNFTPGDSPLTRLCAAIGGKSAIESFTVKTGGGGLHIYVAKPPAIPIRNGLSEFPGIEFKSVGRQVVGPGSVHPDTKQPYVVLAEHGFPRYRPAVLPLLGLIHRPVNVPFEDVDRGGGPAGYVMDAETQGRYTAYLQDGAPPSVEGKGGDANALQVALRGRDLGLPPGIVWELMMETWNKRCTPSWDPAELKAKVANAYRYAKNPVGTKHPKRDFESVPDYAPTTASPVTVGKAQIPFELGKDGTIKHTFFNLLNYLKYPDFGLAEVFAYNDFTGQVEVVGRTPWHRCKNPAVTDNDLKLLKGFLVVKHGFEMTIGSIEEAIVNVSYASRFHPVREYLDRLEWDGVKRIDTWLAKYAGAPNHGSKYVEACSRKILCAAVSRVFHPGCKYDYVPVLEGEEGIGKSAICEILGGEWYTSCSIDLGGNDADAIQKLQGKWIVEFAELDGITKRTEAAALKAFITRPTDRARFAYGRMTHDFPRQCVFWATLNPEADNAYLKSDTGNRRFWPITLAPTGGKIDFRGLVRVRNQLWAEAVMVTRSEEKLFMEDPLVDREAREASQERHAEHPWVEVISLWLANQKKAAEIEKKPFHFITARQVWCEAMAGMDQKFDRRAQLGVAQVLRALGWRQDVRWSAAIKGMVRGWTDERDLGAAPRAEEIDGMVDPLA